VLTRVQLPKAVPVNTGAVMLKIILYVHNDGVAPFGPNQRSRILSIDQHGWSIATAPIRIWDRGI